MRETTTKHTPGPWENSHGTIMAAAGKVAEAGNPGYDGFAAESEGEAIANARLIAAAPDLLAALRVAIGYVESQEITEYRTRGTIRPGTKRDADNIRAAIARAALAATDPK